MQDGKKSGKRDMVILSIKPKRPEYPASQEFVPVKQVLQDWDQLDAYYRGQLLKFGIKSADQGPLTESESTYLTHSNKSYNNNNTTTVISDRSRSRSKGSTKSSKNSRSRGKHNLQELFGDENVPTKDSFRTDENNNNNNKQCNNNKHHEALIETTKSPQPKPPEVELNYLSVPREDFKIKFILGSKQRSHYLDGPEMKLLHPIKVSQFTPPVPIGLNSVHIQKILYHKNSCGLTPTSTTTTNDVSHQSCDSKKSGKPPDISSGDDSYSNFTDKRFATRKSSCGSYSEDEFLTSRASPLKRPCDASTPIGKMRIISPNGIPVPVSSTSEWSPTNSSHNNNNNYGKKRVQQSSTPVVLKETTTTSPRTDGSNNNIASSSSGGCSRKFMSKDYVKRQKQREMESMNRKEYAAKKANEFEELEAVQLSMKSFEMINNCPLLSPIRSP